MRRRASLAVLDPGLFALPESDKASDLDQHDTPMWAAELIINRKFGDLRAGDVVLEPACGTGSFLRAISTIKPGVRAIGIEIDEARAAIARRTSGHEVLVGDMRRVEIPTDALDAIITNPPFDLSLVDVIVEKGKRLLKEGGRIGLLIGAYAVQTEDRVLRYNEDFSLEVESVPRRLFPGLIAPMIYLTFTKDRKRMMTGFMFYPELADVRGLPDRYESIIQGSANTSGSIWFDALRMALEEHGGEAELDTLYQTIEGRRPSKTQFWREQIRKVARQRCERVSESRYRLLDVA